MRAHWRPFFWEPVIGTGERLMAGVIVSFDGEWTVKRMLRDDILDSLYGRSAANPRRLIDEALELCLSVAQIGGLKAFDQGPLPLMGLHAGPLRSTDAVSTGDALRQAVLLHGSFAQLDGWEELEESDAPAAEEANRRFATEVRELVLAEKPELARNFGKTARLIEGGQQVRFGYLSERAVIHFSVLYPIRPSSSMRDARARIFELSRAKVTAGIGRAALVTWVPTETDPTLGAKQRTGIGASRIEIEREARAVDTDFHAVHSLTEGRDRVLALAA